MKPMTKIVKLSPDVNPKETNIPNDPSIAIKDDGKLKQPAVVFAPGHVSCPDGTKADIGMIRGTFLNINSTFQNVNADAMFKNGAAPSFCINTMENISRTNRVIIVDGFMNSLYSHYNTFATRFNVLLSLVENGTFSKCRIIVPGISISPFEVDPNYFLDYYGYSFNKNIKNFFDLSYEERENVINSGALDSFVVTAINQLGQSIYSVAERKLIELLSAVSFEDPTVVKSINSNFGQLFGSTMADFTYEAAAFMQNITNYHRHIIPSKQLDDLASKLGYDTGRKQKYGEY